MANITVDIKKKSIDIGSNLVAIGKGGMNPGVYDPQEIKADVFDMDNMVDGIDKHYLTTEQIEEFENKQDALTAGENIDITNNVISATDTTYTAGEGISIDENNVISNTRVSAEWGNIEGDIEDQEDLQEALEGKQDVLTAGTNVQIENNVISATDTTYTAGQGISIDANNVISNTQTSAERGNIQGDIEDQTDLQDALADKQDVISDLSEIRSNATAGKNASDTIATYGDIVTHDADEFATADSVGEGVLTIQKNSTTVDTFSANATENKTINITVPTQASDIGALPDTTKYAANLDLSINSSTYVITAQLKDQDGNNIGAQRTVDLPLESVVVDGEYDAENKKIILTLENGNTIEFSVADLVSGLQTEITVDNKLDADLVDDTTASHKFVTSTEKSCISTAVQPGDLTTYAKCCDIPTDNCQLANGCGYTTCTGTLVQSDLAPYAKCCDIPTDNCQLANSCGYTTCTGTLVPSDIQDLAQCCDIPTDNCQLVNGCGYTTCTGDMQYSDFEFATLVGNSITLDLSSKITPSADFTINAPATLKDGQIYLLRVQNGASSYTMTLGDRVTNPTSVDLTLTPNTVDQFVFIAVNGVLEMQSDTPDLSDYQTISNMVQNLNNADHSHYPTAKAVADAMACAGVGDMLEAVYDPCGCRTDTFDYCNLYNTPTIPTDNSQLANGCGYTTCTGTLVDSDIADLAKCCDIPTDNSQLANGCGYTTCTGTLVQCDIANLAKCCDIPTDNCQLGNGCGYITGINCSDVTSALGYTPYNSTNPAGYTTCTGTLTSADIAGLAQCCDLANKQDTLTAGNNISLVGNTISGDFNYAEPTTAAETATKCVCIPEITQLCPGQTIIVKPTITATNCATNLKLNDFDAYPVRYNNAALTSSTDGYVRGANQLTQFLFDGSYWHVVSKSYDANATYTMNYSVDAGKYTAGVGKYAISRYSLVLQKDDGTWETVKETSTNYSTATTKTVNTNGFVLGKIRYYNTSTVVANGGLIATNTLNNKAASVDMRYSTNCGGTTDWAAGDFIYLVGTIGADGLFYLDTTKRWSNTLPNTKDNKVYIRLGIALAAEGYTMSLLDDRPILYYDNGIKIYQQADNKQDVISDLVTIRSGAALGATAIQPNDNISELTNDVGYITSAPVTSVNNQTGDVVLTIPTTASDVGALPNTTKYGATLTLEVNSSTYVVTATLKDQDGNTLGTTQTIDLPLESVVVSGSYDDTTKKIILTLQSGSTVEFSVADLVTGLQSEITSTNKLSSDLVDDTNHTNKFVTAAEKTKLSNLSGTNTGDETGTTIKTKLGAASASQDGYLTSTDWSTFNNKQNAISDLATIRSGAEAGATALQPGDLACYAQCCDMPDTSCLAQCCDIPTNNCQLTNGCGYTTCTGTLSTCSDITTALGYTPYSAANPNGYTTCTGTLTSGDLKTINGDSIVGSGDIEIGGGAISGWNSYDYSSSHPASITLNSDYYNHSITINANGSTVTSVSYGSGYNPTPGAQYSFDIINPSTNDLIITILGTQLVVFGDDEGYVHNIFNFIYDDTAGMYRVIAGTENLLTQTQYDSLNAGARTDGVLRWIVEK